MLHRNLIVHQGVGPKEWCCPSHAALLPAQSPMASWHDRDAISVYSLRFPVPLPTLPTPATPQGAFEAHGSFWILPAASEMSVSGSDLAGHHTDDLIPLCGRQALLPDPIWHSSA
jgi:hypothetical protein